MRIGGWREDESTAQVQGAIGLRTTLVDEVPDPPAAARLGHWRADTGSGTHERNEWTGADDLRLDGVT